ncbi:C39 family peptidase [Streptomyces sp. NBC_00659]|uniref:C39 family peptidase n=1 Tax=Streptomyces sp. NBC_00659 TaxID=2903669 RepID=UPI002E358BB0|nr:C39 family peptidase [Streptomyces sp. NBC_00659]
MSKELVHAIITGTLSAREDPRWQESGAESLDEYDFWSWRCCGMACLNMALDHWMGLTQPTVTLAKECMASGGYIHKDGRLIGLIYRPFANWVEERYALPAAVHTELTVGQIQHAVAEGKLVMASVHPDIRWPDRSAPGQGGHLVLVAKADDNHLYLNNPSGIAGVSQEYAPVTTHDFTRFFAGRGVILSPPRGS